MRMEQKTWYGLTAVGMACALGKNASSSYQMAQRGQAPGFRFLENFLPNGERTPFGCACGMPEPQATGGINITRPRCLQLLDLVLKDLDLELKELLLRVTPNRIGVILGTSNSTMEEFSFAQDSIDMATPAHYLREKLGIRGPAYVVSTACSSSAKAFSSARRLLSARICDAVLVGGVDSFARVVLDGFYSLEALSCLPMRPLAKNREGINLGEGAAVFILERERGEIELAGIGESSDAYHLTAPDPQGKGAERAMRAALQDASLTPEEVDYINLHGTGTYYNDLMECAAVFSVFGKDGPLCSSTKPVTGHTLGAAGAIEAGLCWQMLKYCGKPFVHSVPEKDVDPELAPIRVAYADRVADAQPPRVVLSNGFAFGGSNAALILRRRNAEHMKMGGGLWETTIGWRNWCRIGGV